MGARERRTFLAIVLLAIVVRLIQASLVATISGDGPIYLAMARHFLEGDFSRALGYAYTPLYALLVVGPYVVVRDWVLAGRAVSILVGLVTIVAMYLFTRRRFGAGPAMFVALLLVFQPFASSYSVRADTTALYSFLLICSVSLGLRALETRKARYWLGCGCIAGLNWLARPEALGVIMITAGFGVVMLLRSLRERWGVGLRNLTVLVAGASIVMTPYLVHMRIETGVWRLSKKKSVAVAVMSAVGMTPPASDTVATGPAPTSDYLPTGQEPSSAVIPAYSGIDGPGYLRTLAGEMWLLVKSIGPVLLALIALALVRRRASPRDRLAELYVGAIVLCYVSLYAFFYVAEHHLAPLVPLCVLWAGIGLYEIVGARAMRASNGVIPEKNARSGAFGFAIVLLVIASMLPFTFRPQDRDKICQKKVGLWLHGEAGPGVVLLTDMSRLAYYAQANQATMKNRPGIERYEDLVRFFHAERWNGRWKPTIEYLAVDTTTISGVCRDFLDKASPEDLIAIHEEPKLKHGHRDKIILYKVVRH